VSRLTARSRRRRRGRGCFVGASPPGPGRRPVRPGPGRRDPAGRTGRARRRSRRRRLKARRRRGLRLRRTPGPARHVPAGQHQPGRPQDAAAAQRRPPTGQSGQAREHEPGQEGTDLHARLLHAGDDPVPAGVDDRGGQLVGGGIAEGDGDAEHRRPRHQPAVVPAGHRGQRHAEPAGGEGDDQRTATAEAVDQRPRHRRQHRADGVHDRRQRPERRVRDAEIVGDERAEGAERIGKKRADRHPERQGDDETDLGTPGGQGCHAT
jgi:hypothetical protein